MLRRTKVVVVEEGLPPISKMINANIKPTLPSPSQRPAELRFGNQPPPPLRSWYPRSMPTRCLLKCQLDNFALQRSPWYWVGAVRCYKRSAAVWEVEEALLNYLHETSSLPFPDAEYISKNSPKFVDKLIATVSDAADGSSDKRVEIGRSIRNLLLYEPINEFEPFFESLGLRESEISHALRSCENLLMLRDHETLLGNYNLLHNFGIPRGRIGRMYVKQPNIFDWKPSELMARLQAYKDLGLSIRAIIKLVCCCPSVLVDQDFACVFRRLTNLGFEEKWITRSLLDDKTSYNWAQGMQVLDFFLNEMGCREEDVSFFIRSHPLFLFNESEKKVYVATAILTKLGMKMDAIMSLLLRSPQIISANFLQNLCHSIRLLYAIGMREGEIASIVSSHPDSMGKFMLLTPKRALARSASGDPHELCDAIRKDPCQLHKFALNLQWKTVPALGAANRDRSLEKTKFLLKLGFLENSDEMEAARKKLVARGDELEKRFDVLVNAGLSYHDVRELVKSKPEILTIGAGALQKKIDFLVSSGYPVETLVGCPQYVQHSLSSIKTKVSMMQWLKKNDLLKKKWSLSSIVSMPRARFEGLFVNFLPEARDVWTRLNQTS